jgi:hypothetical protein
MGKPGEQIYKMCGDFKISHFEVAILKNVYFTTVNKLRIYTPRRKRVGVAEKRFCEAKTFGARGSSVKKRLIIEPIFLAP